MAGHTLHLWDGRRIKIDWLAMRELRRARLVNARQTQLHSGVIYAIEQGLLSDRTLRHLGGTALTGPEVCICDCCVCASRRAG